MQEGVRGAGPNFEYLLAIKVSVKDKSRFQNRSMISQVERARTLFKSWFAVWVSSSGISVLFKVVVSSGKSGIELFFKEPISFQAAKFSFEFKLSLYKTAFYSTLAAIHSIRNLIKCHIIIVSHNNCLRQIWRKR